MTTRRRRLASRRVCVLSYVYRGQPVRGAEGSVGARCLWVILSGYNKTLLRVNGGSLAAFVRL